MFTSENKIYKNDIFDYYQRHIRILLYVSIFTLIFSRIYDHFSHNVTTPYMDLAFIIPLTGVLILIIIKTIFPNKNLSFLTRQCLDWGLITLMLASLLKGVFIIAGTNSPFLIVYLIIGIILLLISLMSFILSNINKTQKPET